MSPEQFIGLIESLVIIRLRLESNFSSRIYRLHSAMTKALGFRICSTRHNDLPKYGRVQISTLFRLWQHEERSRHLELPQPRPLSWINPHHFTLATM